MKTMSSFWLAFAALLGGGAARAQGPAPSGACADRERFAALFDAEARAATAAHPGDDGASRAQVLRQVRAALAVACPTLPLAAMEAVAREIAADDLAVRVGTTERYEFDALMRHYRSAGMNAVSSCTGGSDIDLRRCLSTQVCRDTGFNSCLCKPPTQRPPVCG